ncbi:hypothetical protein ACQKNC_02775 [Lysinibacillus sp. NPDC094177]|uniref:hypothetical protein n=1 Tax=Lysinibacillus sp. NPDC094177 TaxID=3390580 RepID=UPI003D065B5F
MNAFAFAQKTFVATATLHYAFAQKTFVAAATLHYAFAQKTFVAAATLHYAFAQKTFVARRLQESFQSERKSTLRYDNDPFFNKNRFSS